MFQVKGLRLVYSAIASSVRPEASGLESGFRFQVSSSFLEKFTILFTVFNFVLSILEQP